MVNGYSGKASAGASFGTMAGLAVPDAATICVTEPRFLHSKVLTVKLLDLLNCRHGSCGPLSP